MREGKKILFEIQRSISSKNLIKEFNYEELIETNKNFFRKY